MPYINSIQFTHPGEINFSIVNNSIEIRINNALLGSINADFPVTVYAAKSAGNANILTLRQISDQEYMSGNNNDPDRTVFIRHLDAKTAFKIKKCNSGENYKIISWEDADISDMCESHITKYMDISNMHHFKARIEMVGSTPVMVARYNVDVIRIAGPDPVCSSDLFSYACSS